MIYPIARQSQSGTDLGNCTMANVFLGVSVSGPEDILQRSTNGQLSLVSAMSVIQAGDADPDEGPFVGILSSKVVCEASGLQRGTFSSFSVIVNYVCEGPFCGGTAAGTPIGIQLNLTDQLQLDCTGDNMIVANFVDSGDARTPLGQR